MKDNQIPPRLTKMGTPKRKIIFPQKFSCYEKFPSTESDKELNIVDDYSPRKIKKRHRKAINHNKSTSVSTNNFMSKLNLPYNNNNSHFSNIEAVNDEKKKHGANAYVCDECGKILRSNDTLSRHKISHSGSKPFLCDVCDQGFSSVISLKEHKAKHENIMLYECNICSKKFRQNSCYCRHLKTHSKTLHYNCNICHKKFALKDYLKSHMKKHTGERKYSCDLCKKSFIHQSDLNRHKITHTGERPYKCDICGLTFTDNSSRRRHEKDHGILPKSYNCDQCSLQLSTKILLQQHIEKNHRCLSPILLVENYSDTERNFPVEKVLVNKDSDLFPMHSFSKNNPSASQLSIPEIPTVESSSAKSAPSELVEYREILESEEFGNTCIEFESSLQTTSSPTFKEICLTAAVNVRETNSANDNYQCFSEGEKSNYSNVELQNVSCQVDYVTFPDFNSQTYYTWLADFASLCKLLTFPIESELFNKISQVHKSIADVLANPLGLLSNKHNFKILRNISQDLFEVTNGHLNFIYEHLNE